MRHLFLIILLSFLSMAQNVVAQSVEGTDTLKEGHAQTCLRIEKELSTWEAQAYLVNGCLLAPSEGDRAAVSQVLTLLRAEKKTRDALLAVDSEVLAADGKPSRPIYFSRPYNDLTAETKYADRMIGILEGQLKGAQAQTLRLTALGETWKTAAAGDPQKMARIDLWIDLMNQELTVIETALKGYRERTQPGWYYRANLIAKYDLPAIQLRVQAARTAINAADVPLLEKQLEAALNVLMAGRATTEAMAEFNARMTRKTPLIVHTFDEEIAFPDPIWDMSRLGHPPAFRWLDEKSPVRQILYRGDLYQGKPTDVFAYYATPGTLAGNPALDKDLPALVLVHGGGDRAFHNWVTFWAQKGYAAIAMDLAGCGPNAVGEYDKLFKPERLLRGGPGQDGKRKFLDINLPLTDQWPYHAVANVVRAHSLIRTLPGIDPDRTAIAGISWGGYTTCIAAGVDSRFKAAMPFYGCGYLAENSVWKDMGLFDELGNARSRRWTDLWDPSRYAGKIAVPVFAVTGASDFAYPLESFAKTYALSKGPVQFRITSDMGHGAQFLTTTPEAVVFMDSLLRDGGSLPVLMTPQVGKESVTAKIIAGKIVTAKFYYTNAPGPNKTRQWKSVGATVSENSISAALPPASAVIGYFTVTDNNNHTVSTEVIILNQ